jgi:metal-dependent amidase/aminoacylase/carboxypeptidase family protein
MQNITNGVVKECCKDVDNLVMTHLTKDELVNVCKVCGCRHFELTVDPIQLGIRGRDTHATPQPKWY